jgi:hypothetical protein
MDSISRDASIRAYLSESEIRSSMDASLHVGDCPARARTITTLIRDLKNNN